MTNDWQIDASASPHLLGIETDELLVIVAIYVRLSRLLVVYRIFDSVGEITFNGLANKVVEHALSLIASLRKSHAIEGLILNGRLYISPSGAHATGHLV